MLKEANLAAHQERTISTFHSAMAARGDRCRLADSQAICTQKRTKMSACSTGMPTFCTHGGPVRSKMSAPEHGMPTFSAPRAVGMNLTASTLREAGIGSFFRPSQLEDVGISRGQLRRLVSRGVVEHAGRGLYWLAAADVTEHHTLAAACARVPHSIICLLSALTVHGIGTQLPREVWMAIPHKARAPRLDGIDLRLLRFTGASWSYGVDDISFEGVPARITSPSRTVVDCFRFERLIGREAALEALREALTDRRVSRDELTRTLDLLPSRSLRHALAVIGQ